MDMNIGPLSHYYAKSGLNSALGMEMSANGNMQVTFPWVLPPCPPHEAEKKYVCMYTDALQFSAGGRAAVWSSILGRHFGVRSPAVLHTAWR